MSNAQSVKKFVLFGQRKKSTAERVAKELVVLFISESHFQPFVKTY